MYREFRLAYHYEGGKDDEGTYIKPGWTEMLFTGAEEATALAMYELHRTRGRRPTLKVKDVAADGSLIGIRLVKTTQRQVPAKVTRKVRNVA